LEKMSAYTTLFALRAGFSQYHHFLSYLTRGPPLK
jgi:hypothetical protein